MRIVQIGLAVVITAAAICAVLFLRPVSSGDGGEDPQHASSPDADQPLAAPPRLARPQEPEIRFAGRPDFVVDIAAPEPAADLSPNGLRLVLHDMQTRTYDDHVAYYGRQVFDVETGAGADALQQIYIPMDPVLHSLDLHTLTVTRDGETRNMNADLRHEIVRADSSLDHQILTGGVVVVLRLPRLRPGDRAEIDYTIMERFPVAGWRPSVRLPLGMLGAAETAYFRTTWPEDLVQHASLGPAPALREETAGGLTSLVYGPAHYDPPAAEAFTPPWRFPQPQIVASVYPDWHSVAVWGESLFRPVVDDEVRAIANEIRAEHAAIDAQIAAALRYVQSEIRYLAITLGAGGYQPLLPSETLRYGDGDCKAKTLLLISILAALDIPARAALVSTTDGRALDRFPPTPHAFDHVIVAVMHGNRRYWVDPTMPPQEGRLRDLAPTDWSNALILDTDTGGLTPIDPPTRRRPMIDVSETFTLRSGDPDDNRAVIRAEWRFRDEWADQLRAIIEYNGEGSFRDSLIADYERRYAESAPVGEPQLTDEGPDGLLFWGEWHVTLDNFNSPGSPAPQYFFAAHAASRAILPTHIGDRQSPLMLPYPHDVRHRVSVNLPEGTEDWMAYESTAEIENAAFAFSDVYVIEDRSKSLTARTRVLAPELLPEDFLRAQNDMRSFTPVSYLVIGLPGHEAADRAAFRRLVRPSIPTGLGEGVMTQPD